MSEVSLADQISAVKREIAIRERVYPAWVKNGRLKQETADREIKAMTAALHSLMKMQGLERVAEAAQEIGHVGGSNPTWDQREFNEAIDALAASNGDET